MWFVELRMDNEESRSVNGKRWLLFRPNILCYEDDLGKSRRDDKVGISNRARSRAGGGKPNQKYK